MSRHQRTRKPNAHVNQQHSPLPLCIRLRSSTKEIQIDAASVQLTRQFTGLMTFELPGRAKEQKFLMHRISGGYRGNSNVHLMSKLPGPVDRPSELRTTKRGGILSVTSRKYTTYRIKTAAAGRLWVPPTGDSHSGSVELYLFIKSSPAQVKRGTMGRTKRN